MWGFLIEQVRKSLLWQVGAAFLGFLGLLAAAFYRGKAAQRAAQDEASLEALRKRGRVEDEIAAASDSERRGRLSKWVRRDGK